MMYRRSVRRLFVCVLILLPVQYALVGLVGHFQGTEPWPALVLPAFQSTGTSGEPVSVQQVWLEATFEHDERVRVPTDSLLAALPHSQHLGFFRSQCQPERLSGTKRTERCLQEDANDWIRRRVAALYPDHSLRRLDIIWNRLTYVPIVAPGRGNAGVRSTPLDTLSLTW